jgi:HD domain.
VNSVKERYICELEQYFGPDRRRINHALKVLAAAEKIMDAEEVDAATREIVTITAILHDVGIKVAEEKYHSSAGIYQEQEGPAVAAAIMARQGTRAAAADRVAYIIGGHHTAAKNNGLDFQIIWEADLFVNIEEEGLTNHPEKLPAIIAANFRTPAGIALARSRYGA